jgi:hypothetical protein
VSLHIWGTNNIKVTIFWDIVLHGLVEIDRHFKGAYCLDHWGAHCPAENITEDSQLL